jgi:transposase-like protein
MGRRFSIIRRFLDLFFKGVSTRKIVDHLLQFYRIQVSHVAILKWIRKYSQIITEYTREFQPKTSGVWHTDEMTLHLGSIYSRVG